MTEVTSHDWRTVKQQAKRVNACESTIYHACKSGELRHVRLRGRRSIRLTDEAVDEWLLRYEQGPQQVRVDSGGAARRR